MQNVCKPILIPSLKLITSARITKKGYPIVVELFDVNHKRTKKTIGHSATKDWNFEFVHSLPLVLPIVVLQTYIAYRLWNRKIAIDLTESIQQEIELTTNNATPVNDKPQQ